MKKKHLLMTCCMAFAGTLALLAAQFSAFSPSRSDGEETTEPYEVPVMFGPTEDEFDASVIIDANEDRTTWKYDYNQECLKYNYSFSKPGDDWAILPAVNMPAGQYKVAVTYKVAGSLYPEAFSVWVGESQTAEGMTLQLLDCQDLKNTAWETANTTFTLDASAVRYVGIHCTSAKGMFGLWVKDIAIEALDASAPSAPEIANLAFDGLDAELTVKLPSADIGGAALTEKLGLEVLIDNNPVVAETEAAYEPGSEQTVAFTATSGSHVLNVRAFMAKGEGKSYSEYATQQFTASKKRPEPLPIGYEILPDLDEASWVTIIDNSNDNNTWIFDTEKKIDSDNAFTYKSEYATAADDWLILPAYDGSENGVYELAFELSTRYVSEFFEVCYGLTPDPEELVHNVLISQSDYSTQAQYVSFSKKFNHSGEGNFYIAFHATSPASRGNIYVKKISVNTCDVIEPKPASMAIDFDGQEGTIEIELPALDIAEKPLTCEKVTAELYIDGEQVGDAYSDAPGAKINVPLTLEYGTHTALLKTYVADEQDYRFYADEVSQTFSVCLPSSTSFDVPVTFALNSQDFNQYRLVDANADGYTWEAEDECIKYASSRTFPGDDWVFLPKVNLSETNLIYLLSIEYRGAYASYDESLEVWLGDSPTPEAMTRKLIDLTEINNTEFETANADFTVEQAGQYVIGVRARSMAYALYVRNLSVGTIADTPVAPAVAATVSDDNLSAILEWEPVTVGVHGTTIEDVKYRIREYDAESQAWTTVNEDAQSGDAYEPSTSDLKIATFGVEAYITDGNTSEITPITLMLGTPLALPISESFDGGELTISPMMFADGNVKWAIEDLTPEGGNQLSASIFALVGSTKESEAEGSISFPKFIASGLDTDKTIFTINLYCGEESADVAIYLATKDGKTPLAEVDMAGNQGWTDFEYELPKTNGWCQIVLKANFPQGSANVVRIGGYSIADEPVSAIDAIGSGEFAVRASRGELTITGADGRAIQVANLSGAVLAKVAQASHHETIALSKGLYILTIDGQSFKVIIK